MTTESRQAALVARARQAFGLDDYNNAIDPAGMELVRAVALAEWLEGAEAVGIRFRAWAGNERRDSAPWAVELLTDDEIEVTVRYRIGAVGEPVVRSLPIREVWRLARQKNAELFGVVAADPGVWFFAVADTIADGVRYYIELEDRRGIGHVAWEPTSDHLVRGVRAAQRRQTSARERARDARLALGDESSPVEVAALVDHLADAGDDDGPPAVSFVVISKAPGRPSRMVELSGTFAPGRRRLGRLATVGVDALMVAAFGATRHEYSKRVRLLPPVDKVESDGGYTALEPVEPGPVTYKAHRPPHDNEIKPHPDDDTWQQDPTADEAVRTLDGEVERRLRRTLTDRQLEVWDLHFESWLDREIADHLGIAEKTVNAMIQRCKGKLAEVFSDFLRSA
jgi:hypothetical protein